MYECQMGMILSITPRVEAIESDGRRYRSISMAVLATTVHEIQTTFNIGGSFEISKRNRK